MGNYSEYHKNVQERERKKENPLQYMRKKLFYKALQRNVFFQPVYFPNFDFGLPECAASRCACSLLLRILTVLSNSITRNLWLRLSVIDLRMLMSLVRKETFSVISEDTYKAAPYKPAGFLHDLKS